MDIRVFSETLVVLLTVIRCQFTEGTFKFAVVGSRIDLFCETGEEFGVDWVFKNQAGNHDIYRDGTFPRKFVDRYLAAVSGNQTTLSAERVDSTYGGVYECLEGHYRRLLKSIHLLVITPTHCYSNFNLSTMGNTSHELQCSFTIAGSSSSADKWPTELCYNDAQWLCQNLSNFIDRKLYSDCISSASGKLSSEDAIGKDHTSLRINASHKCASNSAQNTSTSSSSTLSALVISNTDGDNQIIIVVCVVVGGIILLVLLLVTMLAKTRDCRKRKSREIKTDVTYEFEIDRSIKEHNYTSLNRRPETVPAYVEVIL